MSHSASAAVLHEISGKMHIQTIDVAEPRDEEVLIEIAACGICHTDLLIRDGALSVPTPVVLGHEGAGHVVSVGKGVTGVQPGDSVLLSYSSCGQCQSCSFDEPAYCHEFKSRNFSASRTDGSTSYSSFDQKIHSHFFGQSAFSTHVVAPQRNIVKAPSDIPLEVLAPLGCGIQTGAGSILNELNVRAGSVVLILGVGAVGSSAVMAAQIANAEKIIALDLSQPRLDLAKELGATHILKSDGRPMLELLKSIEVEACDYILDTTGVPALVNDAISSLNIRGTIGLCAAYPHDVMLEIDFASTMIGGRRVQGIVEGSAVPQDFIPKLISYYRDGRFPFDRLIEYFPFTEINAAMQACESGRVIKPVLQMR